MSSKINNEELNYNRGYRTNAQEFMFFFFLILATPWDICDLSSPARDQTCAPCIGRVESKPLDHRKIPRVHVDVNKWTSEKRWVSHAEEFQIIYVDTLPSDWGGVIILHSLWKNCTKRLSSEEQSMKGKNKEKRYRGETWWHDLSRLRST